MFFFNRKKKDKVAEASVIGGGLAATTAADLAKKDAAKTYAKSPIYDRNLYEKGKAGEAKKNIKLKTFAEAEQNNTKVFDPYTGKELKLTKKEAIMEYGKDKYLDHLAEGDHVTPLERVYKDNRNKPWIKNENIRDIANSDDNLQAVSNTFNNAKRSRTNEEFVLDEEYIEELNKKKINRNQSPLELSEEGKTKAIEAGRKSQKIIDKKMKQTAFKNAVKTGHEAGMAGMKNSAITAATMSGAMNVVAVIKGEKDAGEALADTAVDTTKAAATGYLMTGGITTISHTLSNSSSKFIQALSKSNVPGYIITAVITTGNTITRYANGEINTQECIIELGEKGLNLATAGYSMAVGQALIPIPVVGAAVGALVGSLLTSSLYNKVIDELQNKKLAHDERMRLIQEAEQLRDQERQYRQEIEEYLQNYFKGFEDCFDEALSTIEESFKQGDADGVIKGANKITEKLHGTVQYDSVESFKDFLSSNTVDTF
ncbi:MAG: hypothetical protein IIX56_04155 [Treponema sp.]|nr:hypothetical protein [Treponema sp.]